MEILHSHFPSHEERIFERKFRLDGRNDLRSLEVSKRYREKRTRIEKRDPLVSGWKIRKRQSYELKSSRLFLRGTTGKHLDSSMLVASCEKYCRYCARPDSPGRATTVLFSGNFARTTFRFSPSMVCGASFESREKEVWDQPRGETLPLRTVFRGILCLALSGRTRSTVV